MCRLYNVERHVIQQVTSTDKVVRTWLISGNRPVVLRNVNNVYSSRVSASVAVICLVCMSAGHVLRTLAMAAASASALRCTLTAFSTRQHLIWLCPSSEPSHCGEVFILMPQLDMHCNAAQQCSVTRCKQMQRDVKRAVDSGTPASALVMQHKQQMSVWCFNPL